MNPYLLTAAILTVILGLIHSLRGERLIFRTIAQNRPALHAAGLRQGYLNILCASWHLATLFSWGMAFILYWLAQEPPSYLGSFVAMAIALSIGAGGVLVLIGTKGRHPGWVVMLVIAGLIVTDVV
jgi:predicted permease